MYQRSALSKSANTRTHAAIRIPSDTHLLLQAWMPSYHVCSKFESPGSPHFRNQLPPRAQQLSLPALLVAHLGHVTERGVAVVPPAMAVVAAATAQARTMVETHNRDQRSLTLYHLTRGANQLTYFHSSECHRPTCV